MDETELRASLTDIGEYQVHQAIASLLNGQIGERTVGDDGAILPVDASQFDSIVISTDRLASGVPARIRAKLLIAQTVSDVICMGAQPLGVVIATQWPRSTLAEEVLEFVRETEVEAQRYGCHVVGGDTKEGPQFAAVGTVVATGRRSYLVRRTPIYAGDYIAVTSTGGHRWGERWANQLATSYDLALESDLKSHLMRADLAIDLPVLESRVLTNNNFVRAGLDLSDGIGASLRILSQSNGVGFNVIPDALDELVDPQAAAVANALGLAPRALIMSPGYMWENIYAVDPAVAKEAVAATKAAGGCLTIIGTATAEKNSVTYGDIDSPIIDAASDEKFRSFAWEDRVSHWLHVMKTAVL
jgi:thiamine-monophosphate kinase